MHKKNNKPATQLNNKRFSSKILVVDDTKMNRSLIKAILEEAGYTNVETANDGKEGLKRVMELKTDLVLLDIVMPEMDGYEFCREVRKEGKFGELPIIVQTGLGNVKERARIFEEGATDLITKPVDAHELLARVKLHLDRKNLVEDLRQYKDRISSELSNAREFLDKSIIPGDSDITSIKRNYNVEIASHFQPSTGIGGDFYGFNAISSDEFALFIVDFSGHGIASALNCFRLHTIIHNNKLSTPYPDQLFFDINNNLCELLPTGQFATMFYGVVSMDRNILKYTSAGASPPIIVNKEGEVTSLDSSGLPLGVKEKNEYEIREVEFGSGDCLLLYSDALIESADAKGKTVSEDDLSGFLKKNYKLSAQEQLEALKSSFKRLFEEKIDDDLTINFYKRS